jgi:hypothetical protein
MCAYRVSPAASDSRVHPSFFLLVSAVGLFGALAGVDGGDHVLVVPFDKTL